MCRICSDKYGDRMCRICSDKYGDRMCRICNDKYGLVWRSYVQDMY